MQESSDQPKGKILAIDYGKKFIGLAVSDFERSMAFGRGTILKKDFKDLAEKLKEICLKEQISEILVGLPLAADGSDTPQTSIIMKFVEDLKNHFLSEKSSLIDPALVSTTNLQDLTFTFIDESFTSFEAQEFLSTMGVKKHDQKATLDELAAIFILRRYIDFS